MKTGLFEIDPAALKTAAALLAARLAHVAKPKTPEQTLRIAFQGAVDEIARQLKFTLNWRDEYRLIEGRADSVYGGLVIEYEAPCSLRRTNSSRANSHAIQQVKDYICGLQQRDRLHIERYAGVACDGCFFIFLRFKEGHWYVEPPVPVSPYSCARFLCYLFALQTELATTPENLLRDFGESSTCARDCVRAFYNTLATSTVPKVGMLYRQWAQTFSEVCGYEENSPKLDVAALAHTYGVHPAPGQRRRKLFANWLMYSSGSRIRKGSTVFWTRRTSRRSSTSPTILPSDTTTHSKRRSTTRISGTRGRSTFTWQRIMLPSGC